jgi:hypothetical protein
MPSQGGDEQLQISHHLHGARTTPQILTWPPQNSRLYAKSGPPQRSALLLTETIASVDAIVQLSHALIAIHPREWYVRSLAQLEEQF